MYTHTQTCTQYCQHIPPTALVFASVCLSLRAIVTLLTPQLLPHSGTGFLCCDPRTCVQSVCKVTLVCTLTYATTHTHTHTHTHCLLQAVGQTSSYHRVTFPEGLHVFHTQAVRETPVGMSPLHRAHMISFIIGFNVDYWLKQRHPTFVAPELLFLHHMFWLDQHVYTGICLHANDTQTACYWVTHCCELNF